MLSALYCPEPDNMLNGYYVCNPNGCGSFKVGTNIYFVCTPGFEPVGKVQQHCLEGGQWEDVQPVCQPGQWHNWGSRLTIQY